MNNSRNYQLYFDKEECILEINPLKKVFENINIVDEIYKYNNCYYFGKNKEILKEKAEELKQEWIKEAEERLHKVEDIIF